MTRILFGTLSFAAAVLMFAGSAASQPPGGGKEGKGGKGPPRFELGQVLPPPLVEELNLTPDQAKELDAIQADLKAKLDKLLTAEQKKTVENFRPRGPGGDRGPGGPGGDKGPGGPGGDKGGKGGKGDKGGRPDRPDGTKKGGGDRDAE